VPIDNNTLCWRGCLPAESDIFAAGIRRNTRKRLSYGLWASRPKIRPLLSEVVEVVDVNTLLDDGASALAQSTRVCETTRQLQIETRALLLTYRWHRISCISGGSDGRTPTATVRRTSGRASDF